MIDAMLLAVAVYVGIEHELPDPPYAQYLNARTGATGKLKSSEHLAQACGTQEERRVVRYDGVLGVSLYYTDRVARTTVILIHGADDETRQMGWIVPYFVCNGINVISYDQRGTGESSGNWRANGPPDRARDVDAIYDAFRDDAHVDPQRIGVWGFSNGGWTAPIVALNRPLAFMILKSPPAESIERNALFEQQQAMLHAGRSKADVAQATAAEKAVIDAILGNAPLSAAKSAYAKASRATWYKDSFFAMVPEKEMLAEPYLSGWRRYLSYDPGGVLARVRTPTLALYGFRDRKVDVHHDAPILIAAYAKSGTRLTVKWFSNAGHTLKVTANGFEVANPERYGRGFPDVMMQWLRERSRTADRPRRSARETRNIPGVSPVLRKDPH
ncbi:MAG TPA: alpha/beta hydrolase [Candidatus Cybelea sp.]|nr:alpha/beta hydrolase [Candidatus Cybelea sp.]